MLPADFPQPGCPGGFGCSYPEDTDGQRGLLTVHNTLLLLSESMDRSAGERGQLANDSLGPFFRTRPHAKATTFPAGLAALLTPTPRCVPGIGFRCVAEAAPPVRCPFQLCGEVEQLEFGSEHDLTAEGSVAWAHWGLDSSFAVNHNIGSGRTAKITAVMIGEGQPVRYDDVSNQTTTQQLHPLSNLKPC